jgi:F0F1-type ATP synthase delta subunit
LGVLSVGITFREDTVIDPFTAMAAVSTAVSMIKKASATIDDVRSLGPLLGKYFDAKHTATKAVREAKKQGGSNMAKAIEIELALKQQADFERDLRELFYYSGHAETWEAITARAKAMDQEERDELRRSAEAERQRKRKLSQLIDNIIIGVVAVVVLGGAAIALTYGIVHCARIKTCGF